LRGARSLARNSFGLDLRTSIVSIQELREAGHQARVARFKASPEAEFAMFAGHAYAVAEAWVKDPTTGPTFQVSEAGDNEVDFEGFECRWKPLSLLVLARATAESDRVGTYRRILEAIEAIVDLESSLPVKAVQLALNGPMADFSIEARVRSQRRAGPEFRQAAARARKATVIGKALTLLGVRAGDFDGRQYRAEVARNTDFRKFDGTLRMVLDLSDAELAELRELLAKEHAAGRIVYGVHRASAALITCFVRSYRGDHLHFVDGADGGYALAAKQLKAQLAEIG
jgi:hypothetical protein